MGRALQLAHLPLQVRQRNAHLVGHGDRAGDVEHIVAADQPGGIGLAFAVWRRHGKGRAAVRDRNVRGGIVAPPADGIGKIGAVAAVGADVFVIAVEKEHAVLRQGVRQLKLGLHHPFKRFEGLQMLGTDGGDDAVVRVHDVAQLFDVADPFGAHFADEDLVRRLQRTADRLDHAHGGVVAFRRHEHIVLRAQKRVEIILDAGFAVAAGHADHDKAVARTQNALGVQRIMQIDALFHRLVDQVHDQHNELGKAIYQNQDHQRIGLFAGLQQRLVVKQRNIGQGAQRQTRAKQHACGDQHTLDARGIDQRLFRLFGPLIIDRQQKQRQRHDQFELDRILKQHRDQHQHGQNVVRQIAAEIFKDPFEMGVKAIGIELKEMQRIDLRQNECRQERRRVQRIKQSNDHGFSPYFTLRNDARIRCTSAGCSKKE